MIPNANVATSSFDRIGGSLFAPKNQRYNNFRIQTTGANIIQGQVNKLSITELMFPYDIPTIVAGQNNFLYVDQYSFPIGGGAPTNVTTIPINIPAGFYTGSEIVAIINTRLADPAITNGVLSCTYNALNGCISFNNTTTWNPATVNIAYFISPAAQLTSVTVQNAFNFPNALWTLGFRNVYAALPLTGSLPTPDPSFLLTPAGYPQASYPTILGYTAITGASYSGAYTNYIDIVSPSLTQAQYVRDSTTSQNTAKKDVIARIYICDNVSLATSNQIGSRPFVIYRIFPCPKVMKWTVDRSLDAIQLELFDMFGQPLVIPTNTTSATLGSGATQYSGGCRDYSLTLHVHEHDETLEPNVGYKY